jgi:hypothetical protein
MWVTSLMSWRSLALTPSYRSLFQAVLKTTRFRYFVPLPVNVHKCKVKGIILNYENSKVVHFTSLRNMILEDAPPVHVHNTKKIKRKHGGLFVSEPET